MALFLIIVVTACSSNKKQFNRIPEGPYGIEHVAPETSPEIKENRKFKLPTSLHLTRENSAIIILVDSQNLIETLIEVGYTKFTGFRAESFVLVNGKKISLGIEFNSGNGSGLGGHVIHKDMCGIPADSKEYKIEFAVELFETDVPAQHMWVPMSPKCKILWTDTLHCESI